jgi:serine/tyrosine/threonine adenylyltransferase
VTTSIIKFDNTYAKLPSRFYENIMPAKFSNPQLLQFNSDLAGQLGLTTNHLSSEDIAQIFSGQNILETSQPIAMAYAGHQFGHFVPQLGDGRAILLGEIVTAEQKRFDIQLKGAGITKFSRKGDGKSALGPVIREYIVSEAMYHLGVPTTRSLAAVATNETVHRETLQPGGILTRIASSHIRIGHFEYFAARRDAEGLRTLVKYCVHRHYPEIENAKDIYLAFFKKVLESQAALIAHWMDIGFIHGVMNTDNMLISGETIDYGPCAFMDNFNFEQVFSSIDKYGRYAYISQAPIAEWNLSRLADCLIPLYDTEAQSMVAVFENELSNFRTMFESHWGRRMSLKLGLLTHEPQDLEIIKNWLQYLQEENLDYTLSFRKLAKHVEVSSEFKPTDKFKEFETLWRQRLKAQGADINEVKLKMNQVNPVYIPRNHQIESAIQGAIHGDLRVFKDLIQVLKNPFQNQPGFEAYSNPPLPEERITKTFCGT